MGGNGGLYAGDATFFPNLSMENIVRRRLPGKNWSCNKTSLLKAPSGNLE